MPRPPRFFISPDRISGSFITVTGEDVRHIGAVLRMKPGEQLLLCDGSGGEYTVRIVHAGRTEIRTEIMAHSRQALLHPRITLGQGLPKSDKMDLIVQKATELGIASIVPLVTERTIVKLKDGNRMSRWRKVAREAAMQSNRPDIPKIEGVRPFGDFLGALEPGPGTLLLFPWEEASEPTRNVLRDGAGIQAVIVLVGPEGGFSRAEADLAKEKGFHPVSLGPYILRTETAALAVLSMIGYELLG